MKAEVAFLVTFLKIIKGGLYPPHLWPKIWWSG